MHNTARDTDPPEQIAAAYDAKRQCDYFKNNTAVTRMPTFEIKNNTLKLFDELIFLRLILYLVRHDIQCDSLCTLLDRFSGRKYVKNWIFFLESVSHYKIYVFHYFFFFYVASKMSCGDSNCFFFFKDQRLIFSWNFNRPFFCGKCILIKIR